MSMLYDIADDFRAPHGRNNFTLNHLVERMKFYEEEDFTYQTKLSGVTPTQLDRPKYWCSNYTKFMTES